MGHLPDVVYEKIDKYVDSLAPQIHPRIASEIDEFQTKTLDSLEEKVVDAFRKLFDKDKARDGSRDLNDSPPDSYGLDGLPFGEEIASLTRSFSFGKMAEDASDDLQEIFKLTEGGSRGGGDSQSRGFSSDSFSSGAKGFLSAAVGALAEHANQRPGSSGSGGKPDFMDGLLGVLSNTVKEASRNPEEKARMISPEIKEKLGVTLREQHAPLAEQFTRIALDHIKKWLRGNTSSRDMGDAMKGEISGLVTGLAGMFGKKSSSDESSRDLDRSGGDGEGGIGFSRVISDKLSTGLAKVHREVRLEFRKILGGIEKQLFELLPDKFQGPLEKILGGNPFDPSLNAPSQGSRGLGDDIKTKLVDKIRRLVRKVQEMLREGILGVVNGGHRKFERSSWVYVQNMVEVKVQKFLPNVRIHVPDDIGNEGVSVGKPQGPASEQPPGGQHGGQPPNAGHPLGGHDSRPPSQDSRPPPHNSYSQGPPPSFPPPPGSHDQYRPHDGAPPSFPPPPGSHDQYRPHDGAPPSFPPPPGSHEQYRPNDGASPSFPPPPPGNPPYGHNQSYGGDHSQYQSNDQHRPYENQQHSNSSYGQPAPYDPSHAQGPAYNQGSSYGQGPPHDQQGGHYPPPPPPQGENQGYYNH